MDTLYTSGDLLQTLTPRPRVVQKPPSSSNASFNSFHPSPTLEASALPTQKISTSTPISRPKHPIASSIPHCTLQPFITCHDCVQRIVNTSCNTLGRSIARARWYSALKSTRTRSGRVFALPANTTTTLPYLHTNRFRSDVRVCKRRYCKCSEMDLLQMSRRL